METGDGDMEKGDGDMAFEAFWCQGEGDDSIIEETRRRESEVDAVLLRKWLEGAKVVLRLYDLALLRPPLAATSMHNPAVHMAVVIAVSGRVSGVRGDAVTVARVCDFLRVNVGQVSLARTAFLRRVVDEATRRGVISQPISEAELSEMDSGVCLAIKLLARTDYMS